MNVRFAAALFLLLFAGVSIQAQKTAKDEEAFRTVINQMTDAQATYDSAVLDRIYSADFVEISPIGEFDPREKVLTFYTPEAMAKSGGVSINIEEHYRSIRMYGDTAVAIAELTFEMSKSGTSLPSRKMMITVVGRKEKGTWKIASVQYTGIRPPAATSAKPD